MHRPEKLLPLALGLLVLGSAVGSGAPVNVVFMMADDLGWNDVGYHGSEIRTPRIDSIAARGVQLDRYYVTPLCSPTRAALLTGRLPLRLGVDRPIETTGGLPLDELLLPEALRQAGFHTAVAGKWHLGLEHVKFHPNSRGFDSAYGHLGPGVDYWTHIWDGGLDWHRDGTAIEEDGYTTALIGAEAERVIAERDRAKPLFLYVAFNAPHTPMQAPEGAEEAYGAIENPNRRTYAAMVTAMDSAVGGILDALEREGLTESTLVIWCSDNGGAPRFGADNSPLQGGKGGVFEGGIRVPAAVWMPGKVEGGRTVSAMMTAADWFPTIVAATGTRLESTPTLDGIDMWPALADGAEVAREDPYVVGVFGNAAVIDGVWKYVRARQRGGTEVGEHLYRLDSDPGESNDLAAANPERLAELASVLDNFPRAPTVAPDVLPPGPARRGPGGRAPGKRAGGPPGRGGGAVDGWKEITRPPWIEAAGRD